MRVFADKYYPDEDVLECTVIKQLGPYLKCGDKILVELTDQEISLEDMEGNKYDLLDYKAIHRFSRLVCIVRRFKRLI